MRVRDNKLLCDLKAKQKASASCGNIQTGSIGCADFLLHETSRGRKQHVGRGGCDENEIDLFRRNLCLLDGLQRRLGRHIAGIFALRGDAAFLNAGASDDPFVARIDYLRQIVVS